MHPNVGVDFFLYAGRELRDTRDRVSWKSSGRLPEERWWGLDRRVFMVKGKSTRQVLLGLKRMT